MSSFTENPENFTVRRSALEQNTARDLQSLAQLISAEQRQYFVRRFFAGKVQWFDSLCALLEAASTWKVAYRILHQHYKAHGINPWQEEARQLSSLLYKRYFPQDAHVQAPAELTREH
ncbi:MAG: hypothetical protein ONB48_13195 [candidate division KSB1 bacterium]|nr:hypothetical protein [candidate division KSB1 bacterium]MDZ7274945.1 hypothetical protein [candidate division KSB1 bacterium]MDZ7286604.1 hypothetical protein [candidate division KSB1 bacterium]MDZ7299232.1 hypothetical protein [candidate division KSB1 bacterium]MDZ7309185.1 hypothetical protein [candidate division KSB1 bacterium]